MTWACARVPEVMPHEFMSTPGAKMLTQRSFQLEKDARWSCLSVAPTVMAALSATPVEPGDCATNTRVTRDHAPSHTRVLVR